VGTAAGGLPEVVTEGETGFLRPVGDVEGMAEAALKILGDNNLRSRLCENGRKVAAERFGRQAIISEYEAFYREILG
jgi:glycosyltransferase involved in cell wall biosynthesis